MNKRARLCYNAGMDTSETHTQTRAAAQEIIPGRNGGTLTPFDPARARAAQVKSVQSRRNRAMRAAQDRTVARLAASDNTITSWADAWGEMVADQAEALRQAASEGKPRGDDLVQVGQALGAVPSQWDTRQDAGSGNTTNILAISDTAARALAAALARLPALDAHADTIDTDTEDSG